MSLSLISDLLNYTTADYQDITVPAVYASVFIAEWRAVSTSFSSLLIVAIMALNKSILSQSYSATSDQLVFG